MIENKNYCHCSKCGSTDQCNCAEPEIQEVKTCRHGIERKGHCVNCAMENDYR